MYMEIQFMFDGEYDENPFLINEEDYDELREYITEFVEYCNKTEYEFMFYEVEDYINSKCINTIRKSGGFEVIQLNNKHEDYKNE